jgi:glycosyltransferase involved in cell wall biosynthesis
MRTKTFPMPRRTCVILQRTVPGYRIGFFVELNQSLGGGLVVASGDKRDPFQGEVAWVYAPVRNGRLILQILPVALLIAARTIVIELNPRALTSWAYLLAARVCGKRAIVWGHRDNRNGRRPAIRRALEHLAAASVYYTEAERTCSAKGRQRIFVAPNTLNVTYLPAREERTDVIMSARLVPEKDPVLGVRAVAASRLKDVLVHVVGDGPLRGEVEAVAAELGVRVQFHGTIFDRDELASLYSRTFAALSPGYVGLNLNQAVLSGVPLVYRADAPHAPEIAFANTRNSVAVNGEDPETWGSVLVELRSRRRPNVPDAASLAAESQKALGLRAMVAGMQEAIW